MNWLSFLSSIQTEYDEQKAAAAAAFLLHAAGGRMRYLRLLKLLYLADRESWKRYGRPITGDDYVAMKHGPVLSKTYDLIKEEGEEPEPSGPWLTTIERVSSFDVRLRSEGEPDLGPLSRAEVEVLDTVHQESRAVDTWDIVEELHATLPEWDAPRGSKKSEPISPEAILKALGQEDRIKAVKADLDDFLAFKKLLRDR